jgi:hypothetical protein
MTTLWMLYEKLGDEYVYVGYGSTSETCKARARKMFKSRSNVECLIRDPSGRDWMKSLDAGAWPTRWECARSV